jgi:hypothetical protein
MYKNLSDLLKEDFDDTVHKAFGTVNSAFSDVYGRFKRKQDEAEAMDAKSKAAADAEQKKNDKVNATISAAEGDQHLKAIMYGDLFGAQTMYDEHGDFEDPAWHSLSAEKVQDLQKLAKNFKADMTTLKKQLTQRMAKSDQIKAYERSEVAGWMNDRTVNRGILSLLQNPVISGIFANLLTSRNVETAVDKIYNNFVAGIVKQNKRVSSKMSSPLSDERLVRFQGALVNQVESRANLFVDALEKLEHETIRE